MWDLIADVGGTNMRLAAVDAAGTIQNRVTFPSADATDVVSRCKSFCAQQATAPARVVVAAAGVVANGTVQLTNSHQRISEAELAAALGTTQARILNDFEAAAWSLATIDAAQVKPLQGPAQIPIGPRLIVGPGTGLGVGALVWSGDTPTVVPGEGGHMGLSPNTPSEVPVFEALADLWPQVRMGTGLTVEAEAVLSGTGLPLVYAAISKSQGIRTKSESQTAAHIFKAAETGTDAIARKTVDLFRDHLGRLAGDLALVFAAKGGVFLTGGVAQANPWLFDRAFLAAFNAGGRHSHWRQQVPVYLCQTSDFGLIGARNYLARV